MRTSSELIRSNGARIDLITSFDSNWIDLNRINRWLLTSEWENGQLLERNWLN